MGNYKCKTENVSTPLDVTERVAKLVTNNKGVSDFSIRNIAREFNIHYSTLSRHIIKETSQEKEVNSATLRKVSCEYAKQRQIFTAQEELILKSCIMRSSDIIFGFSPKQVRTLAYLCAVKNYIKIPPSWTEKEMAGVD
jgi:IS30 family transposase